MDFMAGIISRRAERAPQAGRTGMEFDNRQAPWDSAAMSVRDRRLAAGLFVLISSIYFATAAGITSSNDGSHFALVRALADKRSLEISDYLEFTENQDFAFNGPLKFSDRPPGTAFLAAPAYALGAFLPGPLAPLHSKHDPDNSRIIYALLVPVLAASLTAVVLFWVLRAHFSLSEQISLLTVLAFAFGSMTWKYGSLLYSHATAGLSIMAAIAVLLYQERTGRRLYFWAGLLLGTSVLMEYTNIVFLLAAGFWAAVGLYRRPGWLRSLFFLCAGGLIPALLLMAYNTTAFGGPLQLSTFHVDTARWPQNTSFLHDFATPLWVGLPAMLFYGSDNQGLFWLAPASLLGLWGLAPLWRRSRRDFGLITGGFVLMLLLFSTSSTFNPFTNDGRYLTPFLGLWFVLTGLGIRAFLGDRPSIPPWRWAIALGLGIWSVQNQIWHIAFSWGHDLSPAALRPWAAAPDNMAALWRAVLPNALNLPLWWGILAVVGTAWLAWNQTYGRRPATDAIQD
jgi:hypothetical protein